MSEERPSDQEIVYRFQQMRQQQMELNQKIAELGGDVEEHKVVEDALSKTEADRKCFRMVSGVLIERTVAEVLPAIKQNKSQIEDLVKQLQKQLETTNKNLADYQKKYNIKVKN
ncbi:hypothetical protein PTSG_04898 [Salpingoeca rosetta]|uniref:Prefoldin subunit 2 n=1 Tax=Salpingoeca rosetta (strain ATCC 50818 / BSB-021) TaxID=946362 RepID=F2U8Y1_SALR5|nr:uncharacterized protein PTSG_04898 [Salpingoeca rosetta]EGD73184.1 hypothetical protein PTSG_04898 [Salpingoeca rosetta]|eukprot:XP_004994215.1 hypothetical protein PTSG_04898 [Salpingoeca rosetta]